MTHLPWPIGKPAHTPLPRTKPPATTEPCCTACFWEVTGKTCLNTPWKWSAVEETCCRCGATTISGLRIRVQVNETREKP